MRSPLFALLCLSSPLLHAGDLTPSEIARRAVPFLERAGDDWIQERKCVSCHQIPAMLWSLTRSQSAGLNTNSARLAEVRDWSIDLGHWMSPGTKQPEEKIISANNSTMALLLLGRPATEAPWVAEFRERLWKVQKPDGSWAAEGQLPLGKRPARETTESSTLWVLLAILSTEPAGQPPSPATERALAFLAAATEPARSTEWYAQQLLLKLELGPAPAVTAALDTLLKRQNPDGGWPWLGGERSDALGTGLAMYAAARSGLPAAREPLQRTTKFLRETQLEDGSWSVPSTRAKDQNRIRETTVYWGTSWAVIGLLESAGPSANRTTQFTAPLSNGITGN